MNTENIMTKEEFEKLSDEEKKKEIKRVKKINSELKAEMGKTKKERTRLLAISKKLKQQLNIKNE